MMGVVFVFLLSVMVPTYYVWANDDDDYEHEYEYGEEYAEDDDEEEGDYRYREEDDDDDEYEDEDDESWQQTPVETIPTVTWDVWSRTVSTEQGCTSFCYLKNSENRKSGWKTDG